MPSVTEIPEGTAVAGEKFRIMRCLGKIQVLLGWMGQVQTTVAMKECTCSCGCNGGGWVVVTSGVVVLGAGIVVAGTGGLGGVLIGGALFGAGMSAG